MLREEGEVRAVHGQLARVALKPNKGCGNCPSSSGQGGGCHAGDENLLEVANRVKAKVGDRVELEIPSHEKGGKLLTTVVAIAMAAMVTAVALDRVWRSLGSGVEPPLWAVALAVAVGGSLGWFGLLRSRRRHQPRLVRIVPVAPLLSLR